MKRYQTIDDLIFATCSNNGQGANIAEISAKIGRSQTCVRKHVAYLTDKGTLIKLDYPTPVYLTYRWHNVVRC